MAVGQSSRAEIAVVGGGPAGLMAAETLAAAGAAVTLYERMPAPGRKFLLAGRGGLNLTHSEPFGRFVTRYGEAQAGLEPAVSAFPPAALRSWAEGLGQDCFVGSSGRVFPRAWKASPLLRAWLGRLREGGVRLALRHRWSDFAPDGGLVFEMPDGERVAVRPDATILALGGASWPRLGADGSWQPVLAEAGVDVRPLRPANCGLHVAWSRPFRGRFAGQPLKRIALSFGAMRMRGDPVVTEAGLEGGPVYALSGMVREALAAGEAATLRVDLRPDLAEADLARALGRPRGKASLSTFLQKAAGLPPVAVGLLRESADGPALPEGPDALARLVKAVPIRLVGTAGIERAISSAGGVALIACDDAFMLRARPGTFVAGEMLDWEAPTGGYLLQAAFATGVAAAKGALRWASSRPPTAT